jgi:small subunit ribosomal protein S18
MSERAKIRARRVTGNDSQQQREISRAIRVAREMALLPYAVRQVTHRNRGRGGRGDRDDRGTLPMPSGPPPPRTGEAPAGDLEELTPAQELMDMTAQLTEGALEPDVTLEHGSEDHEETS